jgi:transcriptional regulator with XRE-family HTH domain
MDLFLSSGFDSMSPDEKAFFRQLGTRIAEFRKGAAVTQVQLAETLNVYQQTVASWEVGRRGVPVATLPALARALTVSIESLVGEKAPPSRAAKAVAMAQAKRLAVVPVHDITRAILVLRGQRVQLDAELARKLDELERKYKHHDEAITAILSAIRQLANPPQPKRRGIGATANLDEK